MQSYKWRIIITAYLAECTVLVFNACLQGTVEMKAIVSAELHDQPENSVVFMVHILFQEEKGRGCK